MSPYASARTLRDGIQLSEAITGVCGHLSSCVKDEPRRHRVEAGRVALHQRQNTGMAEDEEPGFSAQLMTNAAASLWGFKLAG